MRNKVIVAAAGSGKTTHVVESALRVQNGSVLITTYTQANEREIRNRLFETARCVPENITVLPWFTFLLRHGARPYQGKLTDRRIKGLILANGRSGVKCVSKRGPVYYGESDFDNYYFTRQGRMYTDKLAKFVSRCNDESNGEVISRLGRIYTHIFIDEIQDMSGWDLELLARFFQSQMMVTLVGDPRQATYSTANSAKNSKYAKSRIVDFFKTVHGDVEIDYSALVRNYRSGPEICELSDRLYPEYDSTEAVNRHSTGHDGVFLVRPADVLPYLEQYRPVQLRDSAKTHVNGDYEVANFGESKGRSFDRVLIYPTLPMIEWLRGSPQQLKPTSRAKLYVAITRARYSVAFVAESIPADDKLTLWKP